jgi:hypothetical protein
VAEALIFARFGSRSLIQTPPQRGPDLAATIGVPVILARFRFFVARLLDREGGVGNRLERGNDVALTI